MCLGTALYVMHQITVPTFLTCTTLQQTTALGTLNDSGDDSFSSVNSSTELGQPKASSSPVKPRPITVVRATPIKDLEC